MNGFSWQWKENEQNANEIYRALGFRLKQNVCKSKFNKNHSLIMNWKPTVEYAIFHINQIKDTVSQNVL